MCLSGAKLKLDLKRGIGGKIIILIISCDALKVMFPVSVFLETNRRVPITQRQVTADLVTMARYALLVCRVIRDTNR